MQFAFFRFHVIDVLGSPEHYRRAVYTRHALTDASYAGILFRRIAHSDAESCRFPRLCLATAGKKTSV
jgi:hypothetical protein